MVGNLIINKLKESAINCFQFLGVIAIVLGIILIISSILGLAVQYFVPGKALLDYLKIGCTLFCCTIYLIFGYILISRWIRWLFDESELE